MADMIEKTFLSADGKTDVHYYVFTPDTTPRAILQISHGMCEYIGRYTHFAEFLNQNGIIVCGNDHIGHGNSAASENELGYMTDPKHPVEDLYTLNGIMKKRYRSLPYILLGHSMGSFIARRYMVDHGDSIDGAVICGTGGKNSAVGAGIALANIIGKLKGDTHRSKLLKNIAFSGYNKRFGNASPNEWLCKPADIKEKYAADPKCNYIFTVAGFKVLFELLKSVTDEEWAGKVPKALPVYIIAGSEDPVGNYGKGPSEVYDSLCDTELCSVELKLYENDRHEILNESDKETVYADLLKWIDGVCDGVIAARSQAYALFGGIKE